MEEVNEFKYLESVMCKHGGTEGETRERGNAQVIRSHVPLSEMFGYSTQLRSMSQGRAVYSMQFSHYSPAPKSIADPIIAARGGEVEDDE